jgi:alpha-beta hydrolase superfamily lysophospholipase
MNSKLPLVHGAWQGAWVWDEVARLLAARGVEALAVDLPGSGEGRTPPAT